MMFWPYWKHWGKSSYDGVAQGPSQLHIGFFGMSEGQFSAQFTIDLGIDGENHRITLERYDVVDDQDTIVQLCSLVSMLYAGTDPGSVCANRCFLRWPVIWSTWVSY